MSERTPFVADAKEIARFWARVDRSGGEAACWVWRWTWSPELRLYPGAAGAYATFNYLGSDGRKMTFRAHRFAYQIATGETIPEGLLVRHDCDNPPCVNPNHLRLGTHADNARDALERGRIHPWGNPYAPAVKSVFVTVEVAERIKALLEIGWERKCVVDFLNVSLGNVGQVARGKHWTQALKLVWEREAARRKAAFWLEGLDADALKAAWERARDSELIADFELQVDRRGEDDCWNWRGWILASGHGGFRRGRGAEVGAHRFSYRTAKGAIPYGNYVSHSCDNLACVNPNHLRLNSVNEAKAAALLRAGLSRSKVANKVGVSVWVIGEIQKDLRWNERQKRALDARLEQVAALRRGRGA